MKKLNTLFTIVAAAMLAACSNDELAIADGGNSSQAAEGEALEIFKSALVEDYDQLGEENLDGDATRASVNTTSSDPNYMKPLWNVGDEVSLSDGALMYSYKVETTANEGTECVFSVLGDRRAYDSAPQLYAIYPRRAVVDAQGGGWNGNTVTGQVFAQQSYAENTAGDAHSYFGGYYVTKTVAEKVDGQFQFSFIPMASIIDINVSDVVSELPAGEQISAVYVKSNDGVALAGHFTYDFENKKLNTVTAGSNPYADDSRSDVVEVNFFENETDGKVSYSTIKGDGIVRFYVLPCHMQKGVTITIRTNKGNFYTKSSSKEVGTGKAQITTTDETNLGTLAQPYYKKYNFNSLTSAKKGAWMSCIPSNLYCTMLSVPGSNSSASYTITEGAAKCQNLNITEQLEVGVRALDFRITGTDNLELKHTTGRASQAPWATGLTLATVLSDVKSYLANNPTETVFAFLRMERNSYSAVGSKTITDAERLKWSNGIQTLLTSADYKDILVTDFSHLTKLGGCRGKIVCIYCDDLTGTDQTYYGCKIKWNENTRGTTQAYDKNNTLISDFKITYQDCWSSNGGGEVANSASKTVKIKEYVDIATAYEEIDNLDNKELVINFSGYQGTGMNQIDNAETGGVTTSVMPSISPYIEQRHERVGIIMADMVTKTYTHEAKNYVLSTVILSNNFKHVFTNRSRVDEMKKYINYETPNTGAYVSDEEFADGSDLLVRKER